MSVKATDQVGEIPEHEEDNQINETALDDVINEILDLAKPTAARKDDMKHIDMKAVWEISPE